MPSPTPQSAAFFAKELRSARLSALANSEAFYGIIHVVERLGSHLSKERIGDLGEHGDLSKYTKEFKPLAQRSDSEPLWRQPRLKSLLAPFATLYDLVAAARNDAVHQGAYARHLTKNAIRLAIVLEEALKSYMNLVVMDFMVPNPAYAEHWQLVSLVRQQMLENSYSYIPVLDKNGNWHVLSDAAVALYLGAERNGKKRKKCLASTVEQAWESLASVYLIDAKCLTMQADDRLDKALSALKQHPIVLVKSSEGTGLLGVLTALDVL
jgi:predicted transcriptional regulator